MNTLLLTVTWVIKNNSDSKDICLARAAKIAMRDMFEMQAKFTGSFEQYCQLKSVPHYL